MRMSIIKAFSLLVASGRGSRCNELRNALRSNLIAADSETGLSRIYLHKHVGEQHAKDRKRISMELFQEVKKVLVGIDPYYYGPDYGTNKSHHTSVDIMN